MRLHTLLLWLCLSLLSACVGLQERRQDETSFPGHQWTRRFTVLGDKQINALTTDASGNLILAGTTMLEGATSADDSSILVASYDPRGNELWARQSGTPGDDRGEAVTTDAHGNVFVVGTTLGDTTFQTLVGLDGNSSAGQQDVFVTKYDAHGNRQWTRQLGTPKADEGNAVATDPWGNVYVAGTSMVPVRPDLPNALTQDAFLAKLDTQGTLLWKQQLGTPASTDQAERLATDAHGNVYLQGYTNGGLEPGVDESRPGSFVARFDASGARQWLRMAHLPSAGDTAFPSGFAVDAEGNSYLMLNLDATGQPPDIHTNDVLLVKLAPDGTRQWRRRFGTPRDDMGLGLSVGSNGTVTVIGRTAGPFVSEPRREDDPPMIAGRIVALEHSTLFAVSYDATGTLQRVRQFGTSAEPFPYKHVTTWNGCLYVAGQGQYTWSRTVLLRWLCEVPPSAPAPKQQPPPAEIQEEGRPLTD